MTTDLIPVQTARQEQLTSSNPKPQRHTPAGFSGALIRAESGASVTLSASLPSILFAGLAAIAVSYFAFGRPTELGRAARKTWRGLKNAAESAADVVGVAASMVPTVVTVKSARATTRGNGLKPPTPATSKVGK